MSAPQSIQEMVYMINQLGGQGSPQHPLFNAWYYRSKCLITPFWLGQCYAKNVLCL